jgi:hypothetical protein
MARYLLDKKVAGDYLSAVDNGGLNVLMIAARWGKYEFFKRLLKQVDTDFLYKMCGQRLTVLLHALLRPTEEEVLPFVNAILQKDKSHRIAIIPTPRQISPRRFAEGRGLNKVAELLHLEEAEFQKSRDKTKTKVLSSEMLRKVKGAKAELKSEKLATIIE